MPNQSQTKRGRRRRPRRQGNQAPTQRRGRSAMADLRGLVPVFPVTKRVSLRYYEYRILLTQAVGSPAGYVFAANGLFDPDITGTGHQPMGFDQMMVFYEHYTVVHSKISVNFVNASVNVYARAGIYLSADGSVITTPGVIMENGLLATDVLPPIGTNKSSLLMNLDCDIPRYFGREADAKQLLQDEELKGSIAANPAEIVYFVITAWEPTAANVYSVYLDVVIEYDVIFSEPRKITQS